MRLRHDARTRRGQARFLRVRFANFRRKFVRGGPVSRILFPARGGSTTIPLRRLLPDISSCQPGSLGQGGPGARAARSLFGIAPGGACHAILVAKDAVSSYLAVSPLPSVLQSNAWAVCSLWRCPSGFPGRALPGTVALWSPDFPRQWRGHPAPCVIAWLRWFAGWVNRRRIGHWVEFEYFWQDEIS